MIHKRVDGTSDYIDNAAAGAGIIMFDTHELGEGFPDRVFCFLDQLDWVTGVLEIKSQYGTLTPSQRKFFNNWPGLKIIARTGEDFLRQIGKGVK